jgi:hypothetical protein
MNKNMKQNKSTHRTLILVSSLVFGITIYIWGIPDIENCSNTEILRLQIDCLYNIAIFISIYLIFNSVVFAHMLNCYLFKPKGEKDEETLPEVPQDSKPIYPDQMKSWNPITGYNSGEMGEGLNPKNTEK